MRWLPVALAALVVSLGPAVRAGDPDRPKRLAVSLRAGGFDEQGSDVMLRKNGEPGNPLVGWKGSEQVAAALGFDVRPGLTLDLSFTRLDFDFGSDLPGTEPGAEIVSAQIATGDLDELRLAVWLDTQRLGDEPAYYISPERTSKGRIALAVLGAVTKADDLVVADPGRQLLGIENVETGSQSSIGVGARMDYRLGHSSVTIGADLDWMWRLNGDLFTLTTASDSPYSGTTVTHEGLNFLVDVSYHF